MGHANRCLQILFQGAAIITGGMEKEEMDFRVFNPWGVKDLTPFVL